MEDHLTESVMDDKGDGESGREGENLSATSPTTIMEGHLTESIMDDVRDGESGPKGQNLSATNSHHGRPFD